jgi:Fic family protein
VPIKFSPNYQITPAVAQALMRIEALKERVHLLPLNAEVLRSLRETARLQTTHYSTMIEGNRLTLDEIAQVLTQKGSSSEHFPGRLRDELEVKGYYAALSYVEQCASAASPLTELVIKKIHSLVMGEGRKALQPTPYRDGQNVIKDSGSGAIIYMPPEAKDVSKLMGGLVAWIKDSRDLPVPLLAAIAHYQFATIHPYYDGNGRTARLLGTLVLHLGGYDLKGLFALEAYYAKNLSNYYRAISIGPSHNYYFGRETSDITPWIEYFVQGMAWSFEKVVIQMDASQRKGKKDQSQLLRQLDAKKRKALPLFQEFEEVTSKQIGEIFGFRPRTCSALCKKWTEEGFLEIADSSFKARKYRLAKHFQNLL